MIFIVKCVTITRFFHCMCSTLMEKHDFFLLCHPLKLYMILYSTGQVNQGECKFGASGTPALYLV